MATPTLVGNWQPPVPLHNAIKLSPELRRCWAGGNNCLTREAEIPMWAEHQMRKDWKIHKADWVRRGFSMRCVNEKWFVNQWLMAIGTQYFLTPIGEEKLQRLMCPEQDQLKLVVEPAPFKLEPLPNGIEGKLFDYQIQPARQLFRALLHGGKEWGYPGAADLSDMGVGKTYMDLAGALSTGRKVCILCPSVGEEGWRRALQHFGAEAHFIGTYEAVRGAFRPHIAYRDGTGNFQWKMASEIILILDEAQALRHDDTLTVECCAAAIRLGIPIIVASASIAISPTEMRFAGRVTGLHKGGNDWTRFMLQHGCGRKSANAAWKWDGQKHHLQRIHGQLFPRRGARVRKQELGDKCPETVIEVLPIETPLGPEIERQWIAALQMIERLRGQGESESRLRSMEMQLRMKVWQRIEEAIVEDIAQRAKKDVRDGRSVAIFMNFNHTRIKMSTILGTTAGFYGGQNKARRKYWEAEFQANRQLYLVSNVGAGGASVSLHDIHGERPRTSYVFPTDHVIKMYQAFGRVDRVDGKSLSLQFIPYVSGTMSAKMVERTRRKMMNIDTLNDGAVPSEARF